MDMKTNAEEMEKWLNSPIPKRVINEWKKENKLKIKTEEEKTNRIIYSDCYLLWIEQFTLKNPCFSSDILLYSQEGITDEETDMIGDLHFLYEIIEDYANRNTLPAFNCYHGQYYKISYNNICYKIGVISGQGTHFFTRRVNTENKDNFIDFNIIMKERVSHDNKKKKILKKKLFYPQVLWIVLLYILLLSTYTVNNFKVLKT